MSFKLVRKNMYMEKILRLIALLLLVAFIPATATAKKKGEIKFTETTYNFGTVPEHKGTVTHSFKFTNTGDAPLVIVDAFAECGCTIPEYPKAPVMPGKTGVIKVTYNPLGRPGGFTKGVTVKTNGKPKKARIYIKGIVNPNL